MREVTGSERMMREARGSGRITREKREWRSEVKWERVRLRRSEATRERRKQSRRKRGKERRMGSSAWVNRHNPHVAVPSHA